MPTRISFQLAQFSQIAKAPYFERNNRLLRSSIGDDRPAKYR